VGRSVRRNSAGDGKASTSRHRVQLGAKVVLDTVVGIPLSSRPPEIPSLRVRVQPRGFANASFAVVPGVRQLKKSRILRAAGELSPSEMATLDQAVGDYLSE
jgi:mRNA-degrading endonuclease toxin of MazEF toxin-antitoxin module